MRIDAGQGGRPRGVLPPCRRCGAADHERMHALMARWFSAIVALPIDGGYFYLCPSCYDTCVAPRIDELFGHPRPPAVPPDSSPADLPEELPRTGA